MQNMANWPGLLNGGQQFYNTTLEPMQMLQAYRAGAPVVNHVFRPAQQFLPQGLPTYIPPTPIIAQAPRFDQQGWLPGPDRSGGPGGDGSPGGVGTDGGADGSGGAGGGGGGK